MLRTRCSLTEPAITLRRTRTPCSRSLATTAAAVRPLRIGVVGGGPAGFYTAGRLLSVAENARVDLFELLPTPFGLARFGVAPDHPEVKNCEHKFEETARDPRFRFFGNVQVCGSQVSSDSTVISVPNTNPSSLAVAVTLERLRQHYDAVLLTYGASLDRPLGIPGENTLNNVLSARTFVNWYNGHPYHSSLLAPLLDLSKLEHATIIGQGNVALDVARILLKDVDALRDYDVPEHVLAELARSRVKRVDVVGRRGPLQLAATTKELREMLNLPGVGFDIDSQILSDAVRDVETYSKMVGARAKKRAMGLLAGGSRTPLAEASKSWSLQFLQSPVELLPFMAEDAAAPSALEGIASYQSIGAVRYTVNELVPPASSSSPDPSQFSARATSESRTARTDILFKSVGYRSIGLPGLPFDERRGCVRNDQGRVVDEQGARIEGLYTSGWLARGPTGVIATTMFDAFATADLVAQDLAQATTKEKPEFRIDEYSGGKKVVSWEDWEVIDRIERERGREKGKLREKMVSVEEMLEVVG
ncbi:NADPH-adrenodoxin reductase Arh1 [Rhodotorula toruloides]|uniref:NADPH:adrenodoxin oxidoreductase, mitochondrial n=1 Tax=Rhodotorula toruloides TaxID=5286 RepID=A0A511K856_RHOTO|nr:NADPH-adrenodoxin reductase Arh1 [Rhodotorula toruloides]